MFDKCELSGVRCFMCGAFGIYSGTKCPLCGFDLVKTQVLEAPKEVACLVEAEEVGQ